VGAGDIEEGLAGLVVEVDMSDQCRFHSRREFLKTTAVTMAALSPAGRALGANGEVRVAVIGLGGKGSQHARVFSQLPGARLVALCDVDPKRLAEHVQRHAGVFSATDPRKILERKDVDAVVIATPDHWHALLAIWACQAGKDVYVEKPVSHNIWEGGKIVEAAAKYGRVVQAGTQYRSDEGLKEAAEYIRQGNLGKVLWGHVLWYELRGSIGKVAAWVPDGLDYDLYCGPAPVEPLRRERLEYDWHWAWSTGTGDLGNSGIHAFDVCRWFAGCDGLPGKVLGAGGRFAVDDAGQTPNTQFTILDYKPVPICIENRNLPTRPGAKEMDQLLGIREGFILQCEGGYFAGLRGGGWAYDNDGKKIRQFKGDGGSRHTANFVQAVRDRKAELLNAPIRQGHISSAVCHLGNLSYRLGSPATWEEIEQAADAFPKARETVARLKQHVTANKVDLQKEPLSLGPWLTIDPETERIVGLKASGRTVNVKEAEQLARGSYRPPFVVPENV
jgi:predicted dehydrogenase